MGGADGQCFRGWGGGGVSQGIDCNVYHIRKNARKGAWARGESNDSEKVLKQEKIEKSYLNHYDYNYVKRVSNSL